MLAKNTELRGVVKPVPGALPFDVHRWPPRPELADHVDWFWAVRYSLPAGETIPQVTLPDPVVHLVCEDGKATVTGPMSSRFDRLLQGTAEVLGVRFRPAMFGELLGTGGLWALRDRTIDVPDLGLQVPQAAFEGSLDDQREALCGWLAQYVQEAPNPASLRARDWAEQLASDRSLTDVAVAAAVFDVSERTLQRTLRRRVGWTPSEVIRRRRIKDAVARVAELDTGLADLALDLGYCDQAHLCRDFRSLTGVTPKAYAERHAPGA